MNAKELKAKMDREVEIRKLVAKLDREIFVLKDTLKELRDAVDYDNTYSCTIELTEEDPDGFHGKTYEAFKKHLEAQLEKEAEE
jgi:hypothetical protein